MQTAICPGSFDPITLGHLDVIRRASKMFERVVVCVVANPGKHCAITLEERRDQVRRVTASIPNVEVDMWEGLLVDYADRYENPVVVRESVRQTVADMLVLYDLIDSGKFILPPRPGSTENTRFDPSYGLYMGHSQGSQEAGLLLGLTDSVKNAFLSAGGGGVLLSFVDLVPNLDVPDAFKPIVENKSIADLLGMLMGLESGSIRYDTFLTNHIVQPLMDPVDPLNFTPRFVKDPVSGMSPKNIAQTVGLGDRSTPTSTQFAMIASEGLPWVGQVFETNDALQLAGLTESTGSSVHNNITTDSGPVTGGAMQFQYTGQSNPHFVIYYMSSARNAFIEFFRSVLNGETTVSVSGSQSGNK